MSLFLAFLGPAAAQHTYEDNVLVRVFQIRRNFFEFPNLAAGDNIVVVLLGIEPGSGGGVGNAEGRSELEAVTNGGDEPWSCMACGSCGQKPRCAEESSSARHCVVSWRSGVWLLPEVRLIWTCYVAWLRVDAPVPAAA